MFCRRKSSKIHLISLHQSTIIFILWSKWIPRPNERVGSTTLVWSHLIRGQVSRIRSQIQFIGSTHVSNLGIFFKSHLAVARTILVHVAVTWPNQSPYGLHERCTSQAVTSRSCRCESCPYSLSLFQSAAEDRICRSCSTETRHATRRNSISLADRLRNQAFSGGNIISICDQNDLNYLHEIGQSSPAHFLNEWLVINDELTMHKYV